MVRRFILLSLLALFLIPLVYSQFAVPNNYEVTPNFANHRDTVIVALFNWDAVYRIAYIWDWNTSKWRPFSLRNNNTIGNWTYGDVTVPLYIDPLLFNQGQKYPVAAWACNVDSSKADGWDCNDFPNNDTGRWMLIDLEILVASVPVPPPNATLNATAISNITRNVSAVLNVTRNATAVNASASIANVTFNATVSQNITSNATASSSSQARQRPSSIVSSVSGGGSGGGGGGGGSTGDGRFLKEIARRMENASRTVSAFRKIIGLQDNLSAELSQEKIITDISEEIILPEEQRAEFAVRKVPLWWTILIFAVSLVVIVLALFLERDIPAPKPLENQLNKIRNFLRQRLRLR